MAIPLNPYVAGNPVGDSPAFIGRADVLREVLRVLRRPQDNAIVLYGQRRIGKTSILQHLAALLPQEGPYRPVYFDLQDKADWSLDRVLRELARTIAHALSQPAPDLSPDPETAFRQEWLPAVLGDLPEGSSLVLLFDEFDVLADPQKEQAAAAFFPYLLRLLASDPGRLQFVFVIGRNVDDLINIALSLFKGTPYRRVSLLDQEDTADLVRLSKANDTLHWPDEAIERIWQLTCGHPFLTQQLCSHVWERAYDEEPDELPSVTPVDVDAAVLDALEASRNTLEWLWDGLPPAERVVASALAEAGPDPITQDELERLLHESGVRVVIRELQNAPQLLQDWDLIEPANGGYRFRVELLRHWISEYKPLRRVQEELDYIEPVAESLYQAALGFYQGGQLYQAVELLRRATAANPNHVQANQLLAEILLIRGQAVDAFFAQANFQTRREGLAPGEIIVITSEWSTHLTYGDILVKMFAGDLTGSQLRELERRIEATDTSSKIAYAVYDGDLSDDAFFQMGAYKIETGLTIVPLKLGVISETILSQGVKNYYRKLRSLEQEYLGRGANRYEKSNAIKDPTWFFGRRQEADEIIDRLRENQHAGIFGMRKIGKTSLLFHLKQRLSRESIPIAYLGLQGRQINPSRLFNEIVRQIRFFIEASGVVDLPSCMLLRTPAGKATDQMFKEDILTLWQVAERELKAPIMVLMIDEVERIVPRFDGGLASYQRYDEFFAPIRDLSQLEGCLVSVVTAERPTIREEFDRRFLMNAMFELYDERYLSFFSFDECRDMIVKIGRWMGVEYSDKSLQRIFEETAGHPYITRSLCACLVNNLERGQVAEKDVEKAIEASLDKLNGYFQGWWRNLSQEAEQLVNSVLENHTLPTHRNEKQLDALRYLKKQGVICRNQRGKWNITIQLFRRWLEQRREG